MPRGRGIGWKFTQGHCLSLPAGVSGISSVKNSVAEASCHLEGNYFLGMRGRRPQTTQGRKVVFISFKLHNAKKTNLDLASSYYISGRTLLGLYSSRNLEKSIWVRISRKDTSHCLLGRPSSPWSSLPGLQPPDFGSAESEVLSPTGHVLSTLLTATKWLQGSSVSDYMSWDGHLLDLCYLTQFLVQPPCMVTWDVPHHTQAEYWAAHTDPSIVWFPLHVPAFPPMDCVVSHSLSIPYSSLC